MENLLLFIMAMGIVILACNDDSNSMSSHRYRSKMRMHDTTKIATFDYL